MAKKKAAKKAGVKPKPKKKAPASGKATWQSYEQVAAHLLNMFAQDFGVQFFEGKQKVVGKRSGTKWEIDAKGAIAGSSAFLVVECRRFTKSKQSQAKLGSMAYVIMDSGATGGIMVSPYNLQAGADFVARAENIYTVKLTANSTPEAFHMEFVDKLKVMTGMLLVISGGSASGTPPH